MKLNLGSGSTALPGYLNVDRKLGEDIYPLRPSIMRPGGTSEGYEVIRASHVLEHFPHRQIDDVLADWVKQLRPGGALKIAVPDFAKVAEAYIGGVNQPTEGYVMGGQVDADDNHKALFDERRLKLALARAGLVMIRPWKSEIDDCAALPISLNLEGIKPFVKELHVSAVMSLPRVTWTANQICVTGALAAHGINPRQFTGAYWDQCMERAIEEAIAEEKPDVILTVDYDTIFTRREVATLIQLMMCHPEADAIAPMQSARGRETPLLSVDGDGTDGMVHLPRGAFAGDLLPDVSTAHFGLTMLRASTLMSMPKPWFRHVPDANGGWGEGRRDADVALWDAWKAAGHTLFAANRVVVGHLEMMIRWPGQDLKAIYQEYADWRREGPPNGVWQ